MMALHSEGMGCCFLSILALCFITTVGPGQESSGAVFTVILPISRLCYISLQKCVDHMLINGSN